MDIEIKYCNNIELAKITLTEHRLNIKFAPNGTGKSTIARAITLGTEQNPDSLKTLIPFKYLGSNTSNIVPEISGIDSIQSILCFNEEYVKQFVFKQNELLSNSFDIFIRTEPYKILEKEIEDLVSEITKLFTNNPELETMISTLKEMGVAFKVTKSGSGLTKSSTGVNGLSGGNPLHHIPAGLEEFRTFIQSQNSVGWIDWQTKGYEFSDLADNCPFCTSDTADKKEKIKKVGQEYDKNTIKNLTAIINVIERLGAYFSDDANKKLKEITTQKGGLEKEHENFLLTVRNQIDDLAGKLERLRTLSGFHFKDGDKVSEKLPAYKIDLQFFSELKATKTQEVINHINKSIDEVIQKAGLLQGKINSQHKKMQSLIEKHQSDINGFLSYAGYKYMVEIAGEGEKSQLKLLHIDHPEHVSGGDQHLSFGERNAFAIVLFMYECLSKNPDLIILDDPISSFDKNKKYAILNMLFQRDTGSCLKNKTVLMLTHDVEPVIDTVKSLFRTFNNLTSASFLKLSRDQIVEEPIFKDDIQTFFQICTGVLNSNKDDIIKLIYMRRRYEISGDSGDAYQVLSNLFKKRLEAIDSREAKTQAGAYPKMDAAKFQQGCGDIQDQLSHFSYGAMLKSLSNPATLKALYTASQNGYEKLQIFRYFDLNIQNSVVRKFINETYHIENEFICQLDPTKFDTIPEYVIEECDKLLQEIS